MLRILFLNTWGGSFWGHGLREFYISQRRNTDIFCLQEVNRCHEEGMGFLDIPEYRGSRTRPLFVDQFDTLRRTLDEHDSFYAAQLTNALHDLGQVTYDIEYGNAMFVRNYLKQANVNSGIIYRKFGHLNDGQPAARSMQTVTIRKNNTAYVVAHFHGLWNGNGKGDCRERTVQTARVNKFLHEVCEQCREETGLEPRVILGGDFNLTASTMSFQGLVNGPAFGGRAVNLNSRFNITDTRTCHYDRSKPTREADFVLVSSNVRVHSFEAPAEPVVSDHRPLILECE